MACDAAAYRNYSKTNVPMGIFLLPKSVAIEQGEEYPRQGPGFIDCRIIHLHS
jgi:hypothetical protein